MRIHETKIPGVLVIEGDVFADDRGSVMPAWVAPEFAARGLADTFVQCNIVRNHRRGTLRGMHYQRPPMAEVKLVRAVRGSVFDVAVDLRTESPTFCQWTGIELSPARPHLFYLPVGVAHGYQTLEDDAEVMYLISSPYSAAHQAGVRWNDPAVGIEWPITPPAVIHPRDAGYPDLQVAR
jgi:dTDP-4-dehydrorhamnose 3,5-epimerase